MSSIAAALLCGASTFEAMTSIGCDQSYARCVARSRVCSIQIHCVRILVSSIRPGLTEGMGAESLKLDGYG